MIRETSRQGGGRGGKEGKGGKGVGRKEKRKQEINEATHCKFLHVKLTAILSPDGSHARLCTHPPTLRIEWREGGREQEREEEEKGRERERERGEREEEEKGRERERGERERKRRKGERERGEREREEREEREK